MTDTLFPELPKSVASTRLFYRDGSSDKEYHAAINRVDGGYTVTFAFGRRGSALTAGTKTASPVPLEKAQQIYDRLIAEKTAKGLHARRVGRAVRHDRQRGARVGPAPAASQLHRRGGRRSATCGRRLVPAGEVRRQAHHGGRERAARPKAPTARACTSPCPRRSATRSPHLPDCELDGELLGELYVVFDLLRVDGTDLRRSPYRERLRGARRPARPEPRRRVCGWRRRPGTRAEKRAFYGADRGGGRRGRGVQEGGRAQRRGPPRVGRLAGEVQVLRHLHLPGGGAERPAERAAVAAGRARARRWAWATSRSRATRRSRRRARWWRCGTCTPTGAARFTRRRIWGSGTTWRRATACWGNSSTRPTDTPVRATRERPRHDSAIEFVLYRNVAPVRP